MAYFHASNPSYTDLIINEANMLLAKDPLSDQEQNDLDNPVVGINLKEMIIQLMAEGSSTWEALIFYAVVRKKFLGLF